MCDSQVPEQVRGYFFEYELVEVSRLVGTIQYTNRVIEKDGHTYETFKETETVQQMPYPLADLNDSHEKWKAALFRTNAQRHKEIKALEAATAPKPVPTVPNVDFSDINTFFQKEGRGPKLLEFEFDPVTKDPVPYKTKDGRSSFYWFWNHRLTGQVCKRFTSASGKTIDSGWLAKFS